MRKILFILSIVLCPWGVLYAQEGFKITGQLGGSLGGNLVLVGSSPNGIVKLGEAVMREGCFVFAGRVDGMIPAYIMTEEQQPVATLMLENMEYGLIAGESGIEVTGGGESQKIWNEFEMVNRYVLRERMKMEQEARAAHAQQNQMKLQALQQQMEKVMTGVEKKQMELFRRYKNSPVSAFMIASGMAQMDYVSLKALYDVLGETAQNSLYGRTIVGQLEAFRQVEVGSVAPDFQGADLNGNILSLHGIKSKLKLVDFWASWCGPCRREMPNVCKIYKKYHDKGLEIIGVSLDSKKEDWARAMKDEKMGWPNISDLKGWKSEIAALYFVRGIPHMLLLDENNRIVAKNLRGKELEKRIAELLKE
mgnify:CR=1 FL=1